MRNEHCNFRKIVAATDRRGIRKNRRHRRRLQNEFALGKDQRAVQEICDREVVNLSCCPDNVGISIYIMRQNIDSEASSE